MPNSLPNFPHISPADAARRQSAGALLIDVRTPAEFSAAHLPGATCIPLARLSVRIRSLATPATPILLTCSEGHRSHSAALVLTRMGYKNISIVTQK